MLHPSQMISLIAVIFQNQMNFALRTEGCSYCRTQFRENIRIGVVHDSMHRVQSQSVEMIFRQPIQGIVNEEIAYHSAFRTIEINAISPRSFVAAR